MMISQVTVYHYVQPTINKRNYDFTINMRESQISESQPITDDYINKSVFRYKKEKVTRGNRCDGGARGTES